METSEELEWELYDIFISGIFAFPIYEHNAARRIVRYLLMRGVLDEEIANAIEGPTVDLRIWLNRGGKHLVGEWVIAWLNDSRDQYRNRRRTAGSRGRSRLQDRRRIFYSHRDDDAHERSPFSSDVHSYLSSSMTTHRSSLSSDSNDSRWTKEDESDISSDYELEEEEEDDDEEDAEEGEEDSHSVQRRSSVEDEEPRPRAGRPRGSQTLEILVESSTDSVPHYKLHRPQTLNLDPDALSLMRCPTGSWAIDAPDSGHVSDTPCSCLLPCLHSSSNVHSDDDIYDVHRSTQPITDDDLTASSLPVHCSACRSNLHHYEQIVSDARQMVCAVCRKDVVTMDTAADAASAGVRRCQEATAA